jgi:hypothetical protein
MGNKVNNQRQILPNQEAKPVGNPKNANKPHSKQTLKGPIGSGIKPNNQKQNMQPQTARSNGGKGLNTQSQNIQPQTARSNGGKGLNMQSNNNKGVSALPANHNTNVQQNHFPSPAADGSQHGFYDDL